MSVRVIRGYDYSQMLKKTNRFKDQVQEQTSQINILSESPYQVPKDLKSSQQSQNKNYIQTEELLGRNKFGRNAKNE